ncbi:MAG TPA: aldo/keto reductase [Thermoanaerobaculia bacterium]|jgi:aryl-alcohol dehydrogenase-like predicted oxidoreductase|nr:aldo/keto reductase [Thermoanaerobaculia bacterium]
METRKIGPLDVSTVGLGCNNFGGRLDYTRTLAVVDAALEAGINFFDTADIYGGTQSEEFLGRALAGRRDRVILATKFGMKVDEQRQGAKPDYVRQACEDSLRRLRTETIDLYLLHQPDASTPIADTLAALDGLVRSGKVRTIGCSNFSAGQLREAEAAAGTVGSSAKFISVENEYSLLHRDPEAEVLAECERQGLAFLPFFPLASGMLTGKYRQGQPLPENTRLSKGSSRFLNDRNQEIVEKLIAFVEPRGRSLLELAFSWLLSHRAVASVIAGATKPEQVRANVAAAGWHLSPADLAEIDELARA